jgi:hypothetical protein
LQWGADPTLWDNHWPCIWTRSPKIAIAFVNPEGSILSLILPDHSKEPNVKLDTKMDSSHPYAEEKPCSSDNHAWYHASNGIYSTELLLLSGWSNIYDSIGDPRQDIPGLTAEKVPKQWS